VVILAGLLGGTLVAPTASVLFQRYHGYPVPFTASLLLMGAMLTVGVLSGALGFWLVLAYSVAHFVVVGSAEWEYGVHNPVGLFLRVRGALVIAYALLFALVVLVPIVARRLGLILLFRARRSRARSAPTLGTALLAVLTAGLTSLWVLAAPVIIRPWYRWHTTSAAREAMIPLQRHGLVLVLVGAAAVILRATLEQLASRLPALAEPAMTGGQPAPLAPARPRRRLPAPIGILVRATLSTYFLAGLASSWPEAAMLWGVLLIAEVARDAAAASAGWRRAAARVPVVLRLAAIVGVALLVGWLTMKQMWRSGTTPAPLIYAMGPSLFLAGLLLPGRAPASTQRPSADATRHAPPIVSKPAAAPGTP